MKKTQSLLQEQTAVEEEVEKNETLSPSEKITKDHKTQSLPQEQNAVKKEVEKNETLSPSEKIAKARKAQSIIKIIDRLEKEIVAFEKKIKFRKEKINKLSLDL